MLGQDILEDDTKHTRHQGRKGRSGWNNTFDLGTKWIGEDVHGNAVCVGLAEDLVLLDARASSSKYLN